MSKRFIYVISFILVFCLSGAAEAVTDINVVNPSFELDANGVQKTCNDGGIDNVLGWDGHGGWTGTSCDGDDPCACDACWDHDSVTFWPDGNIIAWMYSSVGAHIYQHLDSNDANAVITAGRQYTLSWYGLAWWNQALDATLFYGDDHDANEIVTVTQDMAQGGEKPWDWFYGKFKFVAEAGQPYLGETLGIKFTGNHPNKSTNQYSFMDDVHLTWDYATYAYEPYPDDGAIDVPKNVTLNWKSGTYTQATNGHLVYFGTSYAEVNDADTTTAGIYKGAQNRDANSYNPGTLELGKSYYWRIDEVNDSHTTPPPPVGPWKGDVWSFEVTGYATGPNPADYEEDVPFLELTLYWTAGSEATSHDVYFGTDIDDVNDASTSTSGVYQGNVTDPNYFVPESNEASGGLDVGKTYYWRIDECSATKVLKGKIWRFTIGAFLVVDDFDSYANKDPELWAVWDDYWVNYSGALIYLETDRDYIRDGNSLKFTYDNTNYSTKYIYTGSWMDSQDPAELDVGADWTVGGVKALTLYLLGDPCNTFPTYSVTGKTYTDYGGHRLWVELKEVGTDVKFVKHTDVNDMKEPFWHEFRIPLSDFSDAGVNLANLDRVTIGVGGNAKGGQVDHKDTGTNGQIWLDDIRLYPPRCLPEYGLSSVADITGDCVVDYCDVNVMATDWLIKDSFKTWSRNKPAILTGFPDATSHWDSNAPVGTGSIIVDDGYNIDVSDPCLNGIASMSMTAWIKQTTSNEVAVVASREGPLVGCGDDATILGIVGSGWDGADGVAYDWTCGPDEDWQWDSGLGYPPDDGTWTFIAVAVDPTGATLYMRPLGSALQTGYRHEVAQPTQKSFAYGFTIGNDDKDKVGKTRTYFVGNIDDVRIYDYALSLDDVNNLAYRVADPNPWPVYRYKFDETTGYTASNSGTCAAYLAPDSKANLTDPEPMQQRAVNFRDYEILAKDWLKEFMWPPE